MAKRNTVGTAYVGNSTIGERWDADTESTYPWTSIDRWEIPAKALKVQTVHYRHQDQLAEVPTKLTAGILSSLGDTYGTVITPTIMFAREEYFRNAGLEAATYNSGTKQLTVDLDPTTYKEQLLTAMNWEPFRYNMQMDPVTGAVIGWEGVPGTTQWDIVERQFTNYFATNNPPTNEDERQANAGRTMLAQSFYMGLTQGYVTMADPCPKLSCATKPTPNASADLAKGITGVGKGVSAVIALLYEEVQVAFGRLAKYAAEDVAAGLATGPNGVWSLIADRSGPLSVYFNARCTHDVRPDGRRGRGRGSCGHRAHGCSVGWQSPRQHDGHRGHRVANGRLPDDGHGTPNQRGEADQSGREQRLGEDGVGLPIVQG